MRSRQKHTFSFRPVTSDFADTKSITAKKTIYLVLKKLSPSNVCICKGVHEKNALGNSLCWCLEPNLEHFNEKYENIIKI